MPKVYLSPAMHRQNECCYPRPDGKQCYEALENNEYIDILEPVLNRCGIETKRGYRRTPMNNEDGDKIMRQNVAESNAWGTDVHYVSHTNAANGTVKGYRPIYFTGSAKGKKLAEIMVKYRKQIYPYSVVLNNRTDLYELKNTNAVTFYEEHVFHDNLEDATWFHTHMNEIAESAAKGLCEYFGIPYIAPAGTSSTTTVATTLLRKGSTGSEVTKLQTNLNKLGYNCGAADGNFGKNTEMAVRKFQKDHNLITDGIVGSSTSKAIEIALSKNIQTYSTLAKGSTGPKVKSLQKKLLQIGYYLESYGADGDYGDATAIAVRKFQKDNSLAVDGIAGPNTLVAIDKVLPIVQQEQKVIANRLRQAQPKDFSVQPIINWAENERNYTEKDSLTDLNDKIKNAGDDNYTKYSQEVDALGVFSAQVQGQPWCATWVTDGFINTYGVSKGLDMLCQPNKNSNAACCGDAAEYYQKAGRWYTSPQVGDQVFFKTTKYQYAHTGIVTEVTETEVTTIEGNTSSEQGVVSNGGAVTKKHYPVGYSGFKGFGRPKYEAKQEEPEFEPYVVRLTAIALNVRTGPGTQYPVTMVIRGGGAFTIVAEENGFGKLKSGAGWIMLQHTERVE